MLLLSVPAVSRQGNNQLTIIKGRGRFYSNCGPILLTLRIAHPVRFQEDSTRDSLLPQDRILAYLEIFGYPANQIFGVDWLADDGKVVSLGSGSFQKVCGRCLP